MSPTNPWRIQGISSPTLQWGATRRNGAQHKCHHCGTVLLSGEKPGFCCGPNGSRVNDVAPLPPLPPEFDVLINDPNISSQSRILNLIFSFASMETTHEFSYTPGGPSFIAVQGKLYHRVRPTHQNSAIRWLLHDGFMMGAVPHHELAEDIPLAWLHSVQSVLQRVNPFVHAIQAVAARSHTFPAARLILNEGTPSREIAALISIENSSLSEVSGRRMVISRTNNTNYRISNISRLWEPFAYPLFFPHGTLGWGVHGSPSDIDARLPHAASEDRATTQMWHYRARLLREERFAIFGRLTCEYLVDMHTRDLENRLKYIQKNQERLRQEEDAALMGEDDISPNENIYLPASFLGSRRWASEQVADTLAIAAALGEPTFFITMTCNPEWPEITSQLRPGQNFSDIPIVVVRVFKQKVRVLLDALKTMFPDVGPPVYTIQCVEFQKRGLPHVHILIKYPRACNTPEFIDSVVSAELPTDPADRELVEKFMLHRHPRHDQPPSTYCQKEQEDGSRKCRFGYPQPLQEVTIIDSEGRVHYRRRTEADRNVVAHCLPLIRMLKCHINFEVAGTSHLFQYLFKYIHKGPDTSRYQIHNGDNDDIVNEIEDYWNARYLSAGEAAWRILGFRITQKDPGVTSLAVHLDSNTSNLQYHRANGDLGSLSKLERYFLRPSGMFTVNDENPQLFDDLTYAEYFTLFRIAPYDASKDGHPRYFRERHNSVNAPRMHVIMRSGSVRHIARIQSIRPTQGELFYLRVVLNNRAARSFEDARTSDGCLYGTYQEMAIAMGLFADDNEAVFAVAEAIATLRTPRQIRVLFIHLLIHDCVPAPMIIWTRFRVELSYDFVLKNNGSEELGIDDALQEMGLYLSEYGKSLEQYGLPQPVIHSGELAHEIQRWAGREGVLDRRADAQTSTFNAEQLQVYDVILDVVIHRRPLYYFVDGKAGTGKTTVIRALCDKIRAMRGIVLATATSAFAAQLYDGGRTTHSTFKVPVNERNEMLESSIKLGDARAELIKEASLIIWDEAPMANRAVLACVNDILCNIMRSDRPFGGKVIVLLGDFRQTCPVIRGGSKSTILSASIKASSLWRTFTIHQLVRPIRNAEDPEFSAFVNMIGDGGGPNVPLAGLKIVEGMGALTDFVFPDNIIENPQLCVTRSILAPTNHQVDAYNALILNRLVGEERVYYAADALIEVDDAELPPPEGILDYVRRHTPVGLPPHSISIKIGCVCRLLRNFSIDRGLVKNVRVVVRDLGPRLIMVQVVKDGGCLGEDVLIPRITFETELYSGHTLRRRQFPLAPAYATTFHSCQGLTLDRIGIDLTSPVFSHGQLYTAMSRIRNRDHTVIRLAPGQSSTTNVTYLELLN